MDEIEDLGRRRRSRDVVCAMHLAGVFILLLCVSSYLRIEWATGVAARGTGEYYEANLKPEGSSECYDFVRTLKSRGIGQIRLHNANSDLLLALGEEPSIEVIVGLRNDEIEDLGGSNAASAQRWVARNVMPYVSRTRIIAVAVGNDAIKSVEGDERSNPFLVPAMQNIYLALSSVGLEKIIKVSAPQSFMALSSYSPDTPNTFSDALADTEMQSMLTFLWRSGSFFMLNVNPVAGHSKDGDGGWRNMESLGLPVGSQGSEDIDDRQTGPPYNNIVKPFVDALHVTMQSLDQGDVDVVVAAMDLSISSSFNVDVIRHFVKAPSPGELQTDAVIGVDDPGNGKESMQKEPAFFSSRRLMGTLQAKSSVEVSERRVLAGNTWCVANPTADTTNLQSALDWACGLGNANCAPIQPGGTCFIPNTLVAHASYAFNSYYQSQNYAVNSCDFGGTGQTTTSDPSSGSCVYPSTATSTGTPTSTGSPTSANGPTSATSPSSSNDNNTDSNNNFSPRLVLDRRLSIVSTLILTVFLSSTMMHLRF